MKSEALIHHGGGGGGGGVSMQMKAIILLSPRPKAPIASKEPYGTPCNCQTTVGQPAPSYTLLDRPSISRTPRLDRKIILQIQRPNITNKLLVSLLKQAGQGFNSMSLLEPM